ncbi:MAG: ABC transporter substrate-binding protein [Actinomycetota bacterium]|nr:ABC transporter substrate-binding protein [Actinomycetota bacterium]
MSDPSRMWTPLRQGDPALATAQLSRRTLLRGAVLGGAFVAMPNLLAACGSSDGDGGGGGEAATLGWGTTGIRALDYAHSYDTQTGVPIAISVESLLTFDADLKLVPLLAESWEQPDPLTYVFKVRSGVQYWDGTELTAEDVVFSIQRHLDPAVASEMGYAFEAVESVEETADLEVTVTLSRPDPFFASVQTFTSITPKAFTEDLGDDFGTPGDTVRTMGTGPYKITDFRADDLVTLERNENYRGDPGPFERINVKLFTDLQTMQLAMRSGDIDGTFQVPLPAVRQWDDIEGTTTISAPGLNITSMFFNVTQPPFDDINVRRAFAYCIDRQGLVDDLLGGQATVANSIVPPAQWGALLPQDELDALYAELPQFSLDIEEAKKAIAASAVPDGFSVAIQYPSILAEVGKALLSMSENLKEINVQLEVKEVPPPQWFADLDAETLPIGVIGLAPDYLDPANFIGGTYTGDGPGNRANYLNPEVDALMLEQQSATDPAVRAEAIAEILRLVEPDLPYLHFWWPDSVMAIRETFTYTGFTPLWYNQVWSENVTTD